MSAFKFTQHDRMIVAAMQLPSQRDPETMRAYPDWREGFAIEAVRQADELLKALAAEPPPKCVDPDAPNSAHVLQSIASEIDGGLRNVMSAICGSGR